MKKALMGSAVFLLNFSLASSFIASSRHTPTSSTRVSVSRSASAFSRVFIKTRIAPVALSLGNKDEPFLGSFPLDSKTHSYEHSQKSLHEAVVVSLTFLAVTAGLPTISSAAGPDWGLFEGKSLSLAHPIAMGALFVFQVNTAIKGFNWRRQRTMGDEISDLKKQLPTLPEGAKTLQEAIDMNVEADVSLYKSALDVEREVNALMEERKTLASQNNRDNHYNQGAILAFIGTLFAIEGPLNTYARAGKLFPGPHLYAGAGLVICWAAAAACVPYMQKGSDAARSLHIGANVIGMALFAWQVTTGIPILLKVWELTKWP